MAPKKNIDGQNKNIASLEKMSFYEFIQLLNKKDTMNMAQDLHTQTDHAS